MFEINFSDFAGHGSFLQCRCACASFSSFRKSDSGQHWVVMFIFLAHYDSGNFKKRKHFTCILEETCISFVNICNLFMLKCHGYETILSRKCYLCVVNLGHTQIKTCSLLMRKMATTITVLEYCQIPTEVIGLNCFLGHAVDSQLLAGHWGSWCGEHFLFPIFSFNLQQ